MFLPNRISEYCDNCSNIKSWTVLIRQNSVDTDHIVLNILRYILDELCVAGLKCGYFHSKIALENMFFFMIPSARQSHEI